MILKELFDKPYPYHWIERSDDGWKAHTQLEDGVLEVNFAPTNLDSTEWEINFQRDGDADYTPTGSGDEFRVFATVVAAIKDWYSQQKPKPREIYFSANKYDTANQESRVRLYDRFAKKFAEQTHMFIQDRTDTKMAVSWNLKRKKKPKRVQEVNIDNAKGRGQVPMNQDVDYFGLRVKMKPSTFLALAAPLSRDASDEMKDYIRKGGAIGAPFLVVRVEEGEEPYVAGHEGRNRMKAIQAVEGDEPVETHIFFRGDIRKAKQLTPEIVGRLKKGLKQQVTGDYVRGPLWEDGRIVKGVNTTVDVKPGETQRQAAKFGNKLNKKGEPPLLHSKARKNSTPHVLNNLGLTESAQLNEIFNQKYSWRWVDKDKFRWYASFKSEDGGHFDVYFMLKQVNSSNWYMSFDRDGSHRRSGKGDQFKVFATIGDILKSFVEAPHDPPLETIEFSANKEFDDRAKYMDEPDPLDSRAKLYIRMIGKIGAALGLKTSYDDSDPQEVMFKLEVPQRQVEDTEIVMPDPKDTLGIKRKDMPQVARDHYPELLKYLADHGATFRHRNVHARQLKPVQAEFSHAGVKRMMQTGGRPSDSAGRDKKPLIVSSDMYILDGHHRWLAAAHMNEDVPIIQFNIPVKQLFQLIKDFKYTTYKDIHENISITGTITSKEDRKKNLIPGSDEWFRHWFSRPYLRREEVEQLKTEAVNYIKGVRNEKATNRRRTSCNGGSNERRGN